MVIGAVSFQPYVYHVNAVSPASMNKLSRISDNVLDKKTDFSGLVEAENENPLKMGQTLDFKGMLEMQMQRGRSNAARVMKPAEKAQEETGAALETAKTENAAAKFDRENAACDGSGAQNGVSNFRMQQAISAYEMFMTA